MSIQKLFEGRPRPAKDQFELERQKHSDMKNAIDEMESLYNQKLYHQLTNAIEHYVVEANLTGEECAVFLYTITFRLEKKLNLLRVVALIRYATSRLASDIALLVISNFESFMKENRDAQISLEICKSNVLTQAGRLMEASDILFSHVTPKLEAQVGVDLRISSAFYEASTNYFRASDHPKEFYDSLLLYLAYTPLNTLENKPQTAFELCIAGLVAPGMFDFGDLRTAAILTTLEGDVDKEWILDFVDAAVDGSLPAYKAALQRHSKHVKATFANKLDQLHEKMTLAALIELAFQQPKTNRKITLQEIAAHCDVDLSRCERLIMRAMSLDLIKGSIDSVTSELYLTWVKPRLVDAERIGILKSRFVAWSDNIKQLTTHLESITPDVLAV